MIGNQALEEGPVELFLVPLQVLCFENELDTKNDQIGM